MNLAVVHPSDVLVALPMGLIVVFLGGTLVGWILNRLDSKHPQDRSEGIPGAGKYIGWLERGLIYTSLLAGYPEATAIVIAVKTAARFPMFEKDTHFVEYYLIGTLTSLAVALGGSLLVVEIVK